MEDLMEIYKKYENFSMQMEKFKEEQLENLRCILYGKDIVVTSAESEDITEVVASPQQIKKRAKRLNTLTEDAKEVKENKDINDDKDINDLRKNTLQITDQELDDDVVQQINETTSIANNKTLQKDDDINQGMLMPPPPVPTTNTEQSSTRPQRAAKLRSEKNLKEPKLNHKMRRPSSNESVKIKLEHEQRPSQMHESTVTQTSLSSSRSDNSILIIPNSVPAVIEIPSDSDNDPTDSRTQEKENIRPNSEFKNRSCRINLKRESLIITANKDTEKLQQTVAEESVVITATNQEVRQLRVKVEDVSESMGASMLSSTSNASKKARKKDVKKPPKPIKVERFSDVGLGDSPISSRTRKTSAGKNQNVQEPHKSIYEDALAEQQVQAANTTETFTPPATTAEVAVNEHVTSSTTTPINQTITLGGAPADATFCTNAAQTTFQIAPGQSTFIVDNPNSTITLNKNADPSANVATDIGDATFNVAANDANKSNRSSTLSRQSMVTAKDTSHPQDTSLITEDESFEQPIAKSQPVPPHAPKAPTALKLQTQTKLPLSAKGYKVPSRTNELFNPLVQSPVKKKVEAFEHALQAATIEQSKTGTLRPKRLKETSASHTTPVIGGKVYAPALGKFLTPTQSSTVTPNIGQMRKLPNSTSKAIGFPKTNLKPTTSASAKALSRDNTSDELRKGLSQQAEERKKLREQKHVLAAQQREMREKERTERMAKQAKEREEKRIKKQLEIEKKKREQEDIQLKLRQQEEAAAEAAAMKQRVAKAKAIAEQEQEHLAQIEKAKQGTLSKKKMMPPPNPKPEVKHSYTFDMLHEDDSTDDEDKVSYKRPPPPQWSKSTTRGPAIRMQEHCWSEIIDNMFSVEPVTVNLKEIFPNISSQHLKRNSSVMWSTPPRYSELPKY